MSESVACEFSNVDRLALGDVFKNRSVNNERECFNTSMAACLFIIAIIVIIVGALIGGRRYGTSLTEARKRRRRRSKGNVCVRNVM